MKWSDIKTNNIDDNINWKIRYKYLLSNINDLELILNYVNYKKVGDLYVCICPLPNHNEKTSSFTIYPKGYVNSNGVKQKYTSFYCYGCGEGGNVIRFYQLMNNISTMKEACLKLEQMYNINFNNKDIINNLLKEELNNAKQTKLNNFSFNKINLIISSMCRNYLRNNPDKFDIINNIYKQLDEDILECTLNNASNLIKKYQNKLLSIQNNKYIA